MDKLTKSLFGEKFGMEERGIPMFYKSEKTGNEYAYEDYANHGNGNIYRGFLDLPKEEYPYRIIYGKKEYKDNKWIMVRND